MNKEKQFTCVLCPQGCTITISYDPASNNIHAIHGAGCKKGVPWAQQELLHPMRILCTSVLVAHGKEPLVSVKTDREVAQDSLFKIMEVVKNTVVFAPVSISDVVIENPANVNCSIVATRSVDKTDN